LVKKITESAFASTDSLNHENKINSDINDLVVVMERTPKVIGMIKKLQPEIVLVGFKLLSNVNLSTLIDTGYNLLTKNNCDLVLANDLSQITTDSHTGYLIAGNKTYEKLDSKDAIARAIVERTVQVLECRNTE
ncbi:MAG: phosphopantothenoylcysteine synthetase/decarboxylase, partial [Eubacterium sp.]|nr:phosphopantothenoylcysteine synthetase/decarboxylase [Eubacterium sp.]